MPINSSLSTEQASIYSDLNSLNQIREQGLVDKVGAIKKAAKEFESFFLNMMMKSMRQASEVIGEDSPFNSQQGKMFTSMLDEQMAVNLSRGGHLGIAELMISQLNREDLKASKHQAEEMAQFVPQNTQPIPTSLLKPTELNRVQPVNANLVVKNSQQVASEKASVERKTAAQELSFENQPLLEDIKLKPTKRSLFDSAQDFVTGLLPYAQRAAKALNVDPKVLIAQAALETGWGKFIAHDESGQPGFNLFGIKSSNSWQGESIQIDTLEVEQAEFKKVTAAFRKYQHFAESFEDYAKFIQSNERYQPALESTEQPEQYVKALQESGYATDPNYAEKVIKIFRGLATKPAGFGPE